MLFTLQPKPSKIPSPISAKAQSRPAKLLPTLPSAKSLLTPSQMKVKMSAPPQFRPPDQKDPDVRLSVLKAGIASQYEDVKEDTVSSLIDASSPAAMDILITGLKDPNPDFRDSVKSAIDFLVSQEFDTYDQAQKWWDANRSKYDDDLSEKD